MDSGRNMDPIQGVGQLGYVGFGVSDIGAWREFATDVLGLQAEGGEGEAPLYLRLDEYRYRFILTPTGEDDIVFAGWGVKDEAEMRRVARQVEDFGIEVTLGTPEEAEARLVLGLVKFKDPSGLAIEVYHGALLDHRTFISPRGIDGFKAGSLGLGHIVLEVANVEESLRFYTEALGAKLSDFILVSFGGMKRKLTFAHVNPRHHSIAMTGAGPGGDHSKRMHHFMIEVNSMDDVGSTFSLFQQRKIPTGALGRHTNDRMFSFYGATPSGFNIEFGWGAITIDDEDVWEVQHHRAVSLWGHGMPPRPGGPEPGGGPPGGGPPGGGAPGSGPPQRG